MFSLLRIFDCTFGCARTFSDFAVTCITGLDLGADFDLESLDRSVKTFEMLSQKPAFTC